MTDLGLVLLPGDTLTVRAAGRIKAGDPVMVSGAGQVDRATTGAETYIGIASASCATGDLLTVVIGGAVYESIADGDIVPGDLLGLGDDGKIGLAGPRPSRPRPAAAIARATAPQPGLPPAGTVRAPTARATAVALPPTLPPAKTVTPPAAIARATAPARGCPARCGCPRRRPPRRGPLLGRRRRRGHWPGPSRRLLPGPRRTRCWSSAGRTFGSLRRLPQQRRRRRTRGGPEPRPGPVWPPPPGGRVTCAPSLTAT